MQPSHPLYCSFQTPPCAVYRAQAVVVVMLCQTHSRLHTLCQVWSRACMPALPNAPHIACNHAHCFPHPCPLSTCNASLKLLAVALVAQRRWGLRLMLALHSASCKFMPTEESVTYCKRLPFFSFPPPSKPCPGTCHSGRTLLHTPSTPAACRQVQWPSQWSHVTAHSLALCCAGKCSGPPVRHPSSPAQLRAPGSSGRRGGRCSGGRHAAHGVCVSVCVCVCACACVCVCACLRVPVCSRVRMHSCSLHVCCACDLLLQGSSRGPHRGGNRIPQSQSHTVLVPSSPSPTHPRRVLLTPQPSSRFTAPLSLAKHVTAASLVVQLSTPSLSTIIYYHSILLSRSGGRIAAGATFNPIPLLPPFTISPMVRSPQAPLSLAKQAMAASLVVQLSTYPIPPCHLSPSHQWSDHHRPP